MKQTRSLGSYLHQIMQESGNGPLNDLLREFSLQMLQDPISISANGFFQIEFEFLGSVSFVHIFIKNVLMCLSH